MKGLPILALLSSVVLLCSATPALEPVTCNPDNVAAVARLATHFINEHHDHGYKFRLDEIRGIAIVKDHNACNMELQLNLMETKCHVVNPRHFEDCEVRSLGEGSVMANCTVDLTVRNNDTEVTKYECDTRQVKTARELTTICPDCPTLVSLNTSEGIMAGKEVVKRFNQNETNQNYFTMQEVGRIKLGYIMTVGMVYYAEFALVETRCPRGSKIAQEACKPRCPTRAHHALCRSSYSTTAGLTSVECEFYPPLNTTAPGPGEQEPKHRPPHHHPGPPFHAGDHGPPPHAGDHGPPPHAGDHGPPPHGPGHGPPPHAGDHGPPPHAGDHGPPPHACGHGPPPHGPGHGPPPHADGHGPPPHARGHGPPPHADGHGPPPHADGHGPPPHAGGHGPPPHAGGHGPPPHAGGHGPPPHADGHGPPPHADGHGPPPGQERLPHGCPFNAFHPLRPFHPCHGLLTNPDPALHPICPWPHHPPPPHHHHPHPHPHPNPNLSPEIYVPKEP